MMCYINALRKKYGPVAPTQGRGPVPPTETSERRGSALISMPHVYILQSKRNMRYYIGSTNNIEQRLRHHRSGSTPSTKRLGSMTLVFKQEYKSLRDARKIEKKLKRLKRRDYIDKIVKEGVTRMGP